MLSSGVMDVRQFVDEGVKVAVGTDVAGGYSASMLDALRQVLQFRNVILIRVVSEPLFRRYNLRINVLFILL